MKKRYFLIIALVSFGFGMAQIVNNQARVREQVQTIHAKDEAGQDVTADLEALQGFIAGRMQTSTTLVLKGSYSRAEAAAKAATTTNTNSQVYAQAQAACGRRSDSVTQAKCISNYVAQNSTPGSNPQPVIMPQASAFTKTFTSPGWTFDIAGICFLVGIGAIAAATYLAVL